MRVSEAVVDRLRANGIEVVFGIPGKQTLPLNRGIYESDDLRFVTARHETAVSQAAWGYAETTGRPAATLVVPGPGDMNAMNGLKNALNDCAPMLHLSVETEPEVRGGDGIHETPPDTYDNVVKENVTVETPESAPAEIDRAVAAAMTPPRGPVRVGIPKNFVGMTVGDAEAGEYPRETVTPSPESLDAAAGVLADADAPVVIAGGGVRSAEASAELRTVAERLDAPVATTRKAKGVIPEDHDLALGALAAATAELRETISESDAALAVGTDFDAPETGQWSLPVPDELVHVALHPDDIGTGYDPTVGIVADARAVLSGLVERLPEREGDGAARARRVREARADRIEELLVEEPPLTSAATVRAAREALPRDAIVTGDAGGLRMWMVGTLPVYGPRSYVNPGSWASMGTAVPAAIGAAVAHPDRDVVAMVGDGGLMMALHELHTAVAEEIPVTFLVCNNDDYAIISEEAERSYGIEPGYGWGDAPVEFTETARSMGMAAERAETPDEIREAISRALDREGPSLIEVPTDPREPQARAWLGE